MLAFVNTVFASRGNMSDADLPQVRMAGFSDVETVEIIAYIVRKMFTNYLNRIAGTEVLFQFVEVRQAHVTQAA